MEMLQPVIDVLAWFYVNYAAAVGSVTAALMALVTLFTLIPGEQPEKALSHVLEFIKKISVK
jgi:hypothetical protein